MSRAARRWKTALSLTLVTAGLLWGGWNGSQAWHYRQMIARINGAIEKGLVARAIKDLSELSASYPGSDEVAFLLGTCERARGRPEAAEEAWSRVAPGSAFAVRALEARVELELEQGRLSEAEHLVLSTRADPRFTGRDPSILLGPIYSSEGRLEDSLRLLEELWERHHESGQAASETAINQLWLYIDLRANPVPDQTVRAVLEQAGHVKPDDDRVWLWKALLAIRTKSYADAANWLDRCLRARPEDAAVWRARLEWAVATNRISNAHEALKHLPAARANPAQVENLAAWFAAQSGDAEAERRHLERLIAADPTDFAAADRLINLYVTTNQPDAATALRHRNDEIVQIQARYAKLVKRHQPHRDATELARLAAQIGRRFETRAFLTIALDSAPDNASIRRDLARLAATANPFADSTGTLDDLIARQLASGDLNTAKTHQVQTTQEASRSGSTTPK